MCSRHVDPSRAPNLATELQRYSTPAHGWRCRGKARCPRCCSPPIPTPNASRTTQNTWWFPLAKPCSPHRRVTHVVPFGKPYSPHVRMLHIWISSVLGTFRSLLRRGSRNYQRHFNAEGVTKSAGPPRSLLCNRRALQISPTERVLPQKCQG